MRNKNSSSAIRTTNKLYPPCQANCPVNTDVRGYVSAIGRGDYVESYRLITQCNYFPSVCGRICPHPCESDCRRGVVDEAVSIARLKRTAADHINEKRLFPGEPVKEENSARPGGKKVAVIGSGPAGLTVAADLRKKGHAVTVIEKDKAPGGMLAFGVPNFRLTLADLNEDIARILNLGIQLKLNTQVGKDIQLDELINDFDAVIITVGLTVSRSLPVPGVESANILTAIPFLKAANTAEPVKIGKKTVVVGGGDVAMDVARTALRTGAEEVSVYCLECAEEMPAHDWEVDEAREEGIKIFPAYGPKAFETKGKKALALEFVGCRSVFDETGCFNPQFNEKDKKKAEADTFILAIGQAASLSFIKDSGVELNERRQLAVDGKTLQTTVPKVFAAGEVAKGPGAAIDAVAHAHKAAESVHNFLTKGTAGFKESAVEKLGPLQEQTAKLIEARERSYPVMREAEERVADFETFEPVLNDEQAFAEAHRCLGCTGGAEVDSDKCAACLTCVRVCPYEVPVFKDNVAYVDSVLCQACGFCAADCPAEAISMRVLDADIVDEMIMAAVKSEKELQIICEYSLKNKDSAKDSLTIPCAGRLDVINLLKAFQAGANKVIIKCNDDTCRHKDGFEFIERRASYVNKKLEEMGAKEKKVAVEKVAADTQENKVTIK